MKKWRIVFLLVFAFLFFAFAAQAQDQPEKKEVVIPDDVIFHISVSSAGELEKRIAGMMGEIGVEEYQPGSMIKFLTTPFYRKDLSGFDLGGPMEILLINPMLVRRPVAIASYTDKAKIIANNRGDSKCEKIDENLYEVYREYEMEGSEPRKYTTGYLLFTDKKVIACDNPQALRAVAEAIKENWYKIDNSHLLQFYFDAANARRILGEFKKAMAERRGGAGNGPNPQMMAFDLGDKILSQISNIVAYGDIGKLGIQVKFSIRPNPQSTLAHFLAKQKPGKIDLFKALPGNTLMALGMEADMKDIGELFADLYAEDGPFMQLMLSSMPPDGRDKFKNFMKEISKTYKKAFELMPAEVVVGLLPAEEGKEGLPFSVVEYFRGVDSKKMRALIAEIAGKVNDAIKENAPAPFSDMKFSYESKVSEHKGFEIDSLRISLPDVKDENGNKMKDADKRAIMMLENIFGKEIHYYVAFKGDIGILFFGSDGMNGVQKAIDSYNESKGELVKNNRFKDAMTLFPKDKNFQFYLSVGDLMKLITIKTGVTRIMDEETLKKYKEFRTTGAAGMVFMVKDANLIGGVFVPYTQMKDIVGLSKILNEAQRKYYKEMEEKMDRKEKEPRRRKSAPSDK